MRISSISKVFLLFGCLLSSTTFAQPNKNVIDKIVAQVGDNIVLYSELQGQKRSIVENGGVINENTECELLEQMMYQFLLVNQAELDSVMISDEQVDAEMENRIRQIEAQMKGQKDPQGNPITFESFYGKSKSAVKEEFRETIKKRLEGQEVERGITSAISVSPREVEIFFNEVPKDSLPFINSELSFQQIAIFPSVTKADKEATKKELEDIRAQIISGKKTFCAMAIAKSEDPGSARNCGRIEATRGMMVKSFEQTAYSLKPGEISQVFESEYGYHIMQMVERTGDDYIVNHILISAKPSFDSLNAASVRMEKCHKELLERSITWEQAVKKYSNDVNTKENTGYIANPYTGQIGWSIEDINQVDPSIFLITDQLGVNEISAPMVYQDFMERKEGFRIVRLAGRTEPHVANLKDDYNLFRQLAEEKKKNDAILTWIKSRISTAYVRIDEDYQNCNFQSDWLAKKPN